MGLSMELIKNEQEEGRTFINKLSVAERQLTAAIGMYFLELDPLAIHTVSSAAHNVLADLMKERGKDASIHAIEYGCLRAAKDLHEGKITEDYIRAWGGGALDLVKQDVSLFEENPDFDIDTITSSAPPEFARAYWSDRRHSYNYLKHADRDAKTLLDEAKINNENIIMEAIMCWMHLNMKLTAEMYFFYCALIAIGKIKGNGQKPFDLEFAMSVLSKEEIMALGRGNLCHANYPDDEDYKESCIQKMRENRKNRDGKDIQFFKFD